MNTTQKIKNKISEMYNGAKVSNLVIDEEFGNITANIEGLGNYIDCGRIDDDEFKYL